MCRTAKDLGLGVMQSGPSQNGECVSQAIAKLCNRTPAFPIRARRCAAASLRRLGPRSARAKMMEAEEHQEETRREHLLKLLSLLRSRRRRSASDLRSEEHTSELQSRFD